MYQVLRFGLLVRVSKWKNAFCVKMRVRIKQNQKLPLSASKLGDVRWEEEWKSHTLKTLYFAEIEFPKNACQNFSQHMLCGLLLVSSQELPLIHVFEECQERKPIYSFLEME